MAVVPNQTVGRFTGEADEDVDEFVEAIRISFIPYKVYYGDEQTQAKARLLYLSSRLEGKAKKWWRTVDRGVKRVQVTNPNITGSRERVGSVSGMIARTVL